MKRADAVAIPGLAMVDAMTLLNFAGPWWEVMENLSATLKSLLPRVIRFGRICFWD